VWTIPGVRTKTAKEHRVALSPPALEVFRRAAELRQNGYVFPGVQSGRPMSDMALSMLLRGMHPGFTVHGFRSTFRDWAAETTSYPRDLCEMALAHVVGGV
jgi:integrase